jgi:D-sedoheptulose 7-phosphate isomerase
MDSSTNPAQIVETTLREAARLHEEAAQCSSGAIVRVAATLERGFARGAQVLIFGNGGSAADAQHVAAELVGRYTRVRRALPAVALTADTSTLTAIANDEGYDRVFARQIEALARPGDIAWGISTSGSSPNVVAAFRTASGMKLTTIAFTGGDGGQIGSLVDVHVNVPSSSTPRVQEVHRTLMHAVCDLIERAVVGG